MTIRECVDLSKAFPGHFADVEQIEKRFWRRYRDFIKNAARELSEEEAEYEAFCK